MSTGRGGGGEVVDIPVSTKKVVQDLKEVVGNSEDEIYAMLKECNMDPNETVQRLLSQDSFHEVKRKRDKKKERSGGAKDWDTDTIGRPGGYSRGGGRGGSGRGGSLPRYSPQESAGGRGRAHGRENGIHSGSHSSSTFSNSYPAPSPAKPLVSAPSPVPAPTGSAAPAQALNAGSGSSIGVPNGSSGNMRPSPAPQGAWVSGHSTMADLLKGRGAHPPPPPTFQAPAASPVVPTVQAAETPSHPAAAAPVAASVSSPESTEFYLSTADPVLLTSIDLQPLDAKGTIRSLGNQRPIGDQPIGSMETDTTANPIAVSPSSQTIIVPGDIESGDLETEVEVVAARPSSPSAAAATAPAIRDASVDEAVLSMEAGNSQGHASISVLGGSQFNGRPLYGSLQQPVGTQKVGGSGGSEWMTNVPGHNFLGTSLDSSPQSLGALDQTSSARSYQSLSIQDDEPVIIPTHLRVPEADRSHLSFGSFGADFGTSFALAEVQENKKNVETIAAEEAPIALSSPSSVEAQVQTVQSYGLQQVPTPVGNVTTSVEAPSMVHQAHTVPIQEQPTKADPVVQQTPYFLGASNYPGFGMMAHIPGSQYGYEQAESVPQDVPRIPNVMTAYDPTTSYYTSAFRGAESDRLYSSYIPTNTTSKYSGSISLTAAPSLPSSQERGNSMLASTSPSVSVAQSSQLGSNVQTTQVMPQQALPMHYSQPPSGHFGNYMGYQYVPANFPYLLPSYSHHVHNSSSASYAQPPAGSTYTPAAAVSSYPASGAATVKFPMHQYKSAAGVGNAPHSAPAVGYGGYTTMPSGYASSPAATTGNASGYEDVNSSRYKDSTLYIPSQQQGDSSAVWIQTAMPRDMGPSGAMQTNSYYNLTGQGQHSGYAHSQQQTTHGHSHPNAAYANLYHPSQTGPAPGHQLLQQPQSMVGGGGISQAGAFQRTQQTWNNSNY